MRTIVSNGIAITTDFNKEIALLLANKINKNREKSAKNNRWKKKQQMPLFYYCIQTYKYILLQRKIMCVSVRLIETQKNNQYIQLIYQFITHQTYIYI